MGYDLNLLTVDLAQLEHLRQNPDHTGDFLGGRKPTREVIECVKGWFKATEVKKIVPVNLPCSWPDSEPVPVELYSRAGLQYLLNGTNEPCKGVTNFPNAGYRYPGDQIGQAIELGSTGFGNAHAFLPEIVLELQTALRGIREEVVSARARYVAEEMEWADAVNQVPEDMNALREVVDDAARNGMGLLWYWA